ncbi:MAG TPA: UPF0175 family protein [Candidatus Nanoarchaeia archaeon]|nr:UPF0175 family protein [Candidatus Nanoarchaeia archaeon]
MKLNRVSITLPNELLTQSEAIAKEKIEDRSTVLRELISLGIRQYRLEQAITLYGQGKLSLEKATKIANVSLWKFLDVMKERKMPLRYDLEDLKREIGEIMKS